MDAQALISNLAARGIALIPDGSSLIARPRERLTDADREAIRQRKAALLDLLRIPSDGRAAWPRSVAPDSRHPLEQAEIDRIARLDAERRQVDRQARRGYEFDPSAPSHAEYVSGADPLSDPGHPAHSIVATCQRYGVALRIDEATGELVVGKTGARADEPTQPWPSLLIAIEAHLEAVAALVASGWTLRADFPQGEVA